MANLTLGIDGRWSTLDGRRIYAHAKTAGYLYEARLRALLTRELGVEWGPVRNGPADIDGVAPTVLRAFSRRRADIEAELERRGASSAAAAQVAALQTRRAKDYRVTPERLVPEWRERAAQLGLTRDVISEIGRRGRIAALTPELAEEIAEWLASPTGLTEKRSTFTRRDVLMVLCERLPASAALRATDVERLADEFLRSPRAVSLVAGERRDVLEIGDGRAIATVAAERIYSTPELLALERAILDFAVERRDTHAAVARPQAVERALARRPTLVDEQREMVRRLTLDGDGVALVLGPAGAGKTFALGAAREAWEASGRRVCGAAVARRAARELEEGAGIPSTSVASLLQALERHPRSTLRPRSVLVLDEAGMLPTRELAKLVERVRGLDVKLVLVGDHRQLAAIGPGGAFRALMDRLPVIELEENRRQVAVWERDALRLVREGAAPEAVQRYEDAGRIVVGDDAAALRQRLVADWWATQDLMAALMIAERRVHVDDLNGRAHALMRAAGALGAEEVTVSGASFSVGDRVVVRRNDLALGVVNGDRGAVVAVDPARGRIDLALPGGQVTLPRDYLERPTRHGRPALEHGYAITAHLAQGMICGRTFILATDSLTREAGYVALSRGTESNRIYAIAPAASERDEFAPATRERRDARAELVQGLQLSRAQTLATEATLVSMIELTQQHRALEGTLSLVRSERRSLERERPAWYRPRARTRHVTALAEVDARARSVESDISRLIGHQEALRDQARRGRASARQLEPERSLTRERSIGIDLGR